MLCISLSTSTVCGAVTDNVANSSIEQLLGKPASESEPQTVFDYLRNLTTAIASLTVTVNSMSTQMSEVAANVGNLKATAGGGCYYTVYTSKSYLDGYKLKLTDGTTAKSCFITYDADSNYYAGIVRVPLANDIFIEIIDATTGSSQGKVSTSAVTTSGYATINLDELLLLNYATLFDVNDSLATSMYKDQSITSDSTRFTTAFNTAAKYDAHLDDLLKSGKGITITSKTFSEFYQNQTDFLTVLKGSVGSVMLADSIVGKKIVNTKQLLRWICDDSDAASICQSNGSFCNYIQSTTLPILTKTGNAGDEVRVDGHVYCISITSGHLQGGSYCSDTLIGSARGSYAYYDFYYGGRCSIIWGSVDVNLNGDETILLNGSYCATPVLKYKQSHTDDWRWESGPYGFKETYNNLFGNSVVIHHYSGHTFPSYVHHFRHGDNLGFVFDYTVPSVSVYTQVVAPSIRYVSLD